MSLGNGNILRREKGLRTKSYIVVFREGRNTEPTYINLLKPFKKDYDIYPPILRNDGIGDSFKLFAEKCKRAFACIPANDIKRISSVWFVVDDDGRSGLNHILDLNPSDFKKKPLYVAFSSICIEYWILLHFRDHNGAPVYSSGDNSHSDRIIGLIDKEIARYNKKNTSKIPLYGKSKDWLRQNFDFFLEDNLDNPLCFLTPKPRIVEAFVRAKRIHERKVADKDEFAESVTTFYKLLEYLSVVYFKKVVKVDGEVLDVLEENSKCYFVKNGQKILISNVDEIREEPFFNRKS